MNKIKSRVCRALLEKAMQSMPVVVVGGARQTGKTTLVRDLVPGPARTYYSLDDVGILGQAQEDPDSLLRETPVTIDEVQRAPELLLAVKRHIDRRREPGTVLLTGSANLLLMKTVAETLAGRAYYMELPPFFPREWLEDPHCTAGVDMLFSGRLEMHKWPKGKGDWRRTLLQGGFPPVLNARKKTASEFWFPGYVQTYLERDLRELSEVSSLPDFRRLMTLMANRTARLLNRSDVGREAGITQPTCHRYINLLETGYQISLLPVFAANPSHAVVKSRKIMFNDCGLAAWLAGIRSVNALDTRADHGFWLEQTVFQTLHGWQCRNPSKRSIHYWRSRSGGEVDFILVEDDAVVAVEIKSGSLVGPEDFKGLRIFAKALKKGTNLRRKVVLFGGTTPRTMGAKEYALPLGWFLG